MTTEEDVIKITFDNAGENNNKTNDDVIRVTIDNTGVVAEGASKRQPNGAAADPDAVLPSTVMKTWYKTEPVKLRMEDSGPLSLKPITVMSHMKDAVNRFPEKEALAVKRGGKWVKWTYSDYYQDVRTVAKGFLALGLEPMAAVGILGFNSPEWFLADLGAIFAGGLALGVYTTNSPEACHYVLENSEANIVVVENDQQLQKILKVRDRLPQLKAIIQWDGQPKEKYDNVYTWGELMQKGKGGSEELLESRINDQAPNKCCTLMYTSGTTGNPKGVMLSHDNLTWTTRCSSMDSKLKVGEQISVSYLPLSHIAAKICDLYNGITLASTIYFAQPDALKGSLVDTLKEVRPTAFFGVPRVWEKIQERMREVGRNTTGLKKKIAEWAKDVGYRGNINKMYGGSVPFGWGIANALVFKKVKAALGLDRCALYMSGGAPMAPETYDYFLSLDIPVMDMFGLSETTAPHSVSLPWKFRAHSLGTDMSGAKTKFDNAAEGGDGEICMYGRHVFMGYLDNEEKTHEALDEEGWFRSGDVGRKDADGFLYITGRIKEIIITAGGENIAPVPIEDIVREELPVVSNCMLIGDRRKFLSLLITIKTEVNVETMEPLDQLSAPALDWCRSVGSGVTSVSQLLQSPDRNFLEGIQKGIGRANSRAVSRAQNIQKWSILPKDFSVPGGEFGPTLKLKRPVASKMYADTIDAFYAE